MTKVAKKSSKKTVKKGYKVAKKKSVKKTLSATQKTKNEIKKLGQPKSKVTISIYKNGKASITGRGNAQELFEASIQASDIFATDLWNRELDKSPENQRAFSGYVLKRVSMINPVKITGLDMKALLGDSLSSLTKILEEASGTCTNTTQQ